MRPLLLTVAKNLGAGAAFALPLLLPEANFALFKRFLILKALYTVAYWFSVPSLCVLLYQLNWKSRPDSLLDRVARVLFSIFLPLFAIWYWMFIGWFFGHRS